MKKKIVLAVVVAAWCLPLPLHCTGRSRYSANPGADPAGGNE